MGPASALAAVEHGTVGLAVAVFAHVLLSSGGRDLGVMGPAILLTLPAVVAVAPWRRVPTVASFLVAGVLAGTLAVCLVAPMHFDYSRDIAVVAYGGALGLALIGYARTPLRRAVLAGAICIIGFYEFWNSFVAWFGFRSPSQRMVGTFYQPDMFGTFNAGVSALAFGMALRGPSWLRVVGWATAPFAAAGVVLSSSRASELFLAVAWLTIGAVCVVGSTHRWRVVFSWIGLGAASSGVVVILTSPLVFPATGSWGRSAVVGTAGRTGSDSAGFSLTTRTIYWKVGLADFADHPLDGLGFGAYGLTFAEHGMVQQGARASRYTHDGVLQDLAEGGLVAGLPLAMAALAVLAAAIGRMRQAVGESPWSGTALGGAVGAVVLLGHSLVDWDWTYPAMGALLLASLACSGVASSAPRRPDRVRSVAAVVAIMSVAVTVYPVMAYSAVTRRVNQAQALAVSGRHAAAARAVDTGGWPLLPDAEPAAWLVAAAQAEPSMYPRGVVERSLARTAELATVDPATAMDRARLVFAEGDRQGALRIGADLARRFGAYRTDVVSGYAQLLADSGARSSAQQVLLAGIRRFAVPGYWAPSDVVGLASELQSVAGPSAVSTVCGWSLVRTAFPHTAISVATSGPGAACPA